MITCALASKHLVVCWTAKRFLASGLDLTASYTYCLLNLSLQPHWHLLLSSNIMYSNVNISSKSHQTTAISRQTAVQKLQSQSFCPTRASCWSFAWALIQCPSLPAVHLALRGTLTAAPGETCRFMIMMSGSQPRTYHLSFHIPLLSTQTSASSANHFNVLPGAFGCFGRVLDLVTTYFD